MSRSAVIFDCEFLTAPGAPQRFWCGPADPNPVVAQIGAVRIGTEGDAPVLDTLRCHVVPTDRAGRRVSLDPLFTRLTGIDEGVIDAEGLELGPALDRLDTFTECARLWSWGKDEFNMMAISCYVAGITPPIPVARFGNACDLLLKAGMPLEDIHEARSNTLAAYHDLDDGTLRAHDALDDAMSVAVVIRHLLRQGRLMADDLA